MSIDWSEVEIQYVCPACDKPCDELVQLGERKICKDCARQIGSK